MTYFIRCARSLYSERMQELVGGSLGGVPGCGQRCGISFEGWY
jgi:hypothetical protein